MEDQWNLSDRGDPAELVGKYRASLSLVQTRLRRLRKTFEALDSIVSSQRPGYSPEADKDRKLHDAHGVFDRPSDVAGDPGLSPIEKMVALENLEQDAHQLLTASNEGMAPERDFITNQEPKLDEVVRAKDRIGEKPKHKPAQ